MQLTQELTQLQYRQLLGCDILKKNAELPELRIYKKIR